MRVLRRLLLFVLVVLAADAARASYLKMKAIVAHQYGGPEV